MRRGYWFLVKLPKYLGLTIDYYQHHQRFSYVMNEVEHKCARLNNILNNIGIFDVIQNDKILCRNEDNPVVRGEGLDIYYVDNQYLFSYPKFEFCIGNKNTDLFGSNKRKTRLHIGDCMRIHHKKMGRFVRSWWTLLLVLEYQVDKNINKMDIIRFRDDGYNDDL